MGQKLIWRKCNREWRNAFLQLEFVAFPKLKQTDDCRWIIQFEVKPSLHHRRGFRWDRICWNGKIAHERVCVYVHVRMACTPTCAQAHSATRREHTKQITHCFVRLSEIAIPHKGYVGFECSPYTQIYTKSAFLVHVYLTPWKRTLPFLSKHSEMRRPQPSSIESGAVLDG